MASPNYQFEKRQRELAMKNKKAEKEKKKSVAKEPSEPAVDPGNADNP